MSQNVSGFGLVVNFRASKTFPAGFDITQFADDADPFDSPSLQIADSAMGLNGHMLVWSVANPLQLTLNVIPNGSDDRNLATVLEANRAALGKRPVGDVITLTATYPDGKVRTWSGGVLTDGVPANSIASAGRMKSKPYQLKFENTNGV